MTAYRCPQCNDMTEIVMSPERATIAIACVYCHKCGKIMERVRTAVETVRQPWSQVIPGDRVVRRVVAIGHQGPSTSALLEGEEDEGLHDHDEMVEVLR